MCGGDFGIRFTVAFFFAGNPTNSHRDRLEEALVLPRIFAMAHVVVEHFSIADLFAPSDRYVIRSLQVCLGHVQAHQ